MNMKPYLMGIKDTVRNGSNLSIKRKGQYSQFTRDFIDHFGKCLDFEDIKDIIEEFSPFDISSVSEFFVEYGYHYPGIKIPRRIIFDERYITNNYPLKNHIRRKREGRYRRYRYNNLRNKVRPKSLFHLCTNLWYNHYKENRRRFGDETY